jgi:excisionase family DNA binding protein
MEMLTLDQVAKLLNTTPRHVRGLIRERGLPYVKVGQLIRINFPDLSAWIIDNTHKRDKDDE